MKPSWTLPPCARWLNSNETSMGLFSWLFLIFAHKKAILQILHLQLQGRWQPISHWLFYICLTCHHHRLIVISIISKGLKQSYCLPFHGKCVVFPGKCVVHGGIGTMKNFQKMALFAKKTEKRTSGNFHWFTVLPPDWKVCHKKGTSGKWHRGAALLV